jgi:hypothetical protein
MHNRQAIGGLETALHHEVRMDYRASADGGMSL